MSDDDNIKIAYGLTAIFLIIIIATLLAAYGSFTGRIFGKYREETRTQIVEQSRAYQEGMAQNLDKLCLEWERDGHKAIAQSIRHRSSGYKGELPPHVQQCVNAARKVK